jgi:hypothetical protein
MGKKSGSGGASYRAAGGSGRVRGGGGGSPADISSGSDSYSTSIPWVAIAQGARKLYERYGRAAPSLGPRRRWQFRQLGGIITKAGKYFYEGRRVKVKQARRIVGAYGTPPTAAEWAARKAALDKKTPRKTPARVPPPPPPPPPAPVGPASRPQLPRGFTLQSIVAYVVAQGIVWAVDAGGRWIFQRFATEEEIKTGRAAGGGPRRGGARGPAPREPRLEPVAITARRLALPKAIPGAHSSAQDKIEPIKVTAKRIELLTPVSVYTPKLPMPKAAPRPAGWRKYLPQAETLLKAASSPTAAQPKIKLAGLTAPKTGGLPSVLTQSAFSSFSGFGGTPGKVGTKTCECKPKRKKKPKVPRDVCYTGTYTERADGLTKLKRRKVPCRSSAKSSASRRTQA